MTVSCVANDRCSYAESCAVLCRRAVANVIENLNRNIPRFSAEPAEVLLALENVARKRRDAA
jgi:hypothetical protein